MDLSMTTAPDSTQINAEDLLAGPVTVTITGVRAGTAEQPVNIDLAEYPDRAYRPGKSMRRVLVAAWGADSSNYTGRRLTLYRDAEVKFGGFATGGVRISHMSHLAKPLTLALTVTRGKRAPYVVKPLADAPAPAQAAESARPAPTKQPTADELIGLAESALAEDALNAVARKAVAALSGADLDAVKAVVTARRAELKEPAEPTLDGWPATAEIPQ